MKLYKKYENDLKDKAYHDLARDYLVLNNINVKYYGWHGMCGKSDIVKTDKGYYYFNIDTKKLEKHNKN